MSTPICEFLKEEIETVEHNNFSPICRNVKLECSNNLNNVNDLESSNCRLRFYSPK